MTNQHSRRELLGVAAALTLQQRAHASASPLLSVSASADRIEIGNEYLKACFIRKAGAIEQEYYARTGVSWIRLVRALRPATPRPPDAAPLYSDIGVARDKRLLVACHLSEMRVSRQQNDRVVVTLAGKRGGDTFEQTVSLQLGAIVFHVEVNATLAERPPRLEYLLSTFFFEVDKLDYTHAPCIKREAADVIGDRVFHSPAVVFQDGSRVAALAPDLNLLKSAVVYAPDARSIDGPRQFRILQDPQTITMPAILDVDLESGISRFPVFAYGFADYLTQQHMYWKHENANGAFVRRLSSNHLRYGFDLFVSAAVEHGHGCSAVSRHMWAQYGSHYAKRPKPQAIPFSDYAKVCYPAAFRYKGDTPQDTKRYAEGEPYDEAHSGPLPTWLEFEIDGRPAGGIRATPAQWYNDIQFMGWWNNVHLAQGMHYWGHRNTDQTLIDHAQRIINLTLSAPQNAGIFPAVYNFQEQRWHGCYWKMNAPYNPAVLPDFWNFKSDFYQTCSASKTAGLLLRYHRHYEHDERIPAFATAYGDFIVDRLDANGCLPAWFTASLAPVPYLRFNAEGGVHIAFLAELFSATGDERYLIAAQRISRFLIHDILPQHRWYDFETFYSCASKPEATYDSRTGQWPRCTLSMLWAVDGLTALYEVSGDKQVLRAAEQAADYLSLYQSVWQPPFIITAYAFGGFISQNSDAEWLDMRQSVCGEALVRLGLAAGRQDFLERGVAAMRSAFAVINHPRHIANGIFPTPSYPLGITAENIDHEGLPQLPLRSGSDWGEGGALASAAEILRLLGGVYLNFSTGNATGVDGVAVKSFHLGGRRLQIEFDNLLADLVMPYETAFQVELVIAGLPRGKYQLIANQGTAIEISVNGITRVPILVEPRAAKA